MRDEAIVSGTGYPLKHWVEMIRTAGLSDSPHKTIADFLHEKQGLSYWWAQEVTVEYEYSIGRRIPGQTQDGLFQLGVNRTIEAPAERVWEFLTSAHGLSIMFALPPAGQNIELATLDAHTPDGIEIRTTTYVDESHARLQWKPSEWGAHSILQVRVTAKSTGKCVVTFHQERIPTAGDRAALKERWLEVAKNLVDRIRASE